MAGSHDLVRHVDDHLRHLRIVVQQAVAALVLQIVGAAVGLAHAVDQFADALAHLRVVVMQAADGAFH